MVQKIFETLAHVERRSSSWRDLPGAHAGPKHMVHVANRFRRAFVPHLTVCDGRTEAGRGHLVWKRQAGCTGLVGQRRSSEQCVG